MTERTTGIEPASSAWEADILPMNYICELVYYTINQKKIQLYFKKFFKKSFVHVAFFGKRVAYTSGKIYQRRIGFLL